MEQIAFERGSEEVAGVKHDHRNFRVLRFQLPQESCHAGQSATFTVAQCVKTIDVIQLDHNQFGGGVRIVRLYVPEVQIAGPQDC